MTRRNPPPGQIAQIQVPGVSAQPLGSIRPASPPPPDLSRLQRFAGLSQSVERFLGASADNDRLLSGQEAAAAFAAMTPEEREQLNSDDPEVRKQVLDTHLDKLVDSGILSRADHPRFQAAFRKQAYRAEVQDAYQRSLNRLGELTAIHDGEGSLQPTITPEEIWTEEQAKVAETFAAQDPFARRQVAEEFLQLEQDFNAKASATQAQALEGAARDEVKNEVFNYLMGVVQHAEDTDGQSPIASADLSAFGRIVGQARGEYGMKDSRAIAVAGADNAIQVLRSQDRFNEALEVLGLLERARDSSGNLIVRDADTQARVAELRENLEREEERQNDRDWREEQQIRQRNLQTADNDILRLVLTRQDEGATFAQIKREATDYIMGTAGQEAQPSDIQGVLLDNLDNLLEQEKREAFVSDPEVLENFRSAALTGGLDTAQILDANQSGEITATDAQGLLDQVSTQRSMLDALPPVAQQAMEGIPGRFKIEGAPASLRNELADIGLDRELELRARLEEYWVANQAAPLPQREADFRRIAREFDLETRQDAATIRQDFQSRSEQARERILSKEGTLTLTLADVYAERDNLSQEAFESALARVKNVARSRQDLRAKTLGPLRAQLSISLETYELSEGIGGVPESLLSSLRTVYTQELDALADRFEADVLPTTDPSRVDQAYREFVQEEFNTKVLPRLDPLAAEIVSRMQDGESASEVTSQVRQSSEDPTEIPVNLRDFPELEEFSQALPKDRARVAASAIRLAPPGRQADLFLEVAPRLGIKAQEVLDGQVVLDGGTQRAFGGFAAPTRSPLTPNAPSAQVVIPISLLAETSTTKYQVPLFVSDKEFTDFFNDETKAERLLTSLGIPENRREFWMRQQAKIIARVHNAN